MAAPSLAPRLDSASRRGFPRFPIKVALDVVALQSGIPNNTPGRCTDLSEAGLGAIIAGKVVAGQTVAIELRLPNVGLPVRARAQVRYQDRLRCGLQFVGLTAEQREKIRYWSSGVAAQTVPGEPEKVDIPQTGPPPVVMAMPDKEKPPRRFRVRRRRFFVLVALTAALAAFGLWQWQRAWNELEADTSRQAEPSAGMPLRVSLETMDSQILYKVDPIYPDSARAAGVQGLVLLDAVVATDGTVKSLRPLAGPEVLAQSALEAVQSWRYTPYRSGGRAVEVETTVSVDFQLH